MKVCRTPPRRPVTRKSRRRKRLEKRWEIRRRVDGSKYVQEVTPGTPKRSRRESEADRALVYNFTGPPEIPTASDEELIFRHSGWWKRREQLKTALAAAGANPNQLNAFCNCGANAYAEEFDDDAGGWRVRCFHCKSRWCLPCSRSRALMIADNLKSKIADEAYLHVVLTLKHRQDPLPEQIDRLYRSFKTLRSTRMWKNRTDGGAAFLQCHPSQDGLWHPHLHIVTRGTWIPKQDLSREWLRITGDSDNVGVSSMKGADRLVREVTRYAARPVDDDKTDTHEQLVELIVAMRGRRLCFTFGRWRKFRLTAIPDTPKRPIKQQIRLVDLIQRATRGEKHWQQVLDILRRRANPSNAPPEGEHYL